MAGLDQETLDMVLSTLSRYAEEKCAREEPALHVLPGTERQVACHFPERVQMSLG